MSDGPDPLYYLRNFEGALAWLADRYGDLLCSEELQFLATFARLPEPGRALLVRLAMRKGALFRGSRIRYAEIGPLHAAAAPLIELGWLDPQPALTVTELFRLLTRPELAAIFPALRTGVTKEQCLTSLREADPDPRTLAGWTGTAADVVYRVSIAALCERMRLLFFGNYRQDWAEFVLADLGILRYEAVELSASSRAFQCRRDIDDFFTLYECRQQLEAGAAVEAVLERLQCEPMANEWIESRRARLLFHIAQHFERAGELEAAAAIYQQSSHPESGVRALRVAERRGLHDHAHSLCVERLHAASRQSERDALERVLVRVSRRVGVPVQRRRSEADVDRMALTLPATSARVEQAVLDQLHTAETPAFYVENALIPSLFGLLCWSAIFAPVPGAFFHRFQSGPADLLSAQFHAKRATLFESCLATLASGEYRARIRDTLQAKQGIQSPFVRWGVLTDELVDLALDCVPPEHLRHCFDRLLGNLRDNRNGFPDLIQFWPGERRYRLIEVKGPGDRLQYNQRRWLAFCQQHGIPVTVCYVRWNEAAA